MKGREEGRISSRVIGAFSDYWENCNSNIDIGLEFLEILEGKWKPWTIIA